MKIGNLLSKLADFWRRHTDLNPLRGLGQSNFDLSCNGLPMKPQFLYPASSLFHLSTNLDKFLLAPTEGSQGAGL